MNINNLQKKDELDCFVKNIPIKLGPIDSKYAKEIEHLFRCRAKRLGYGYDVKCNYNFINSFCDFNECVCSKINMKIKKI